MSDDRYAQRTALIHGEQSWGALFADGDGKPIPFTDNNASSYVQKSLDVMKIAPQELSRMRVFNIGSGREAAIFQQMGAGHVTLLDIAPQNVENARRYAAGRNVKNLTAIHGDIQETELPANEYDLVFLAAVFQHIEVPAKGLIRLARSMKMGGRMYLGFTRSGEWKFFIVDAVRYLLSPDWLEATRKKVALSTAMGEKIHYQTGRTMIDFFGPCQHKFHPDDVIHDAKRLGLEVLNFDNDFREYAHEGKDYFSIGGDRIYLVKKGEPGALPPLEQFRTVKGRNQLWDVPYKEPEIQANIEKVRRLKQLIEADKISPDDAQLLAINLYRFTRPFVPEQDEYYQQTVKLGRHAALGLYLDNVIRLYGS